MLNSRENRLALLQAYDDGLLNDKEFILLCVTKKPNTLDLPYWDYANFDLDKPYNDQCKA